MAQAFAYSSGIIYIALLTTFAIDVSARIDWIAEHPWIFALNSGVTQRISGNVLDCNREAQSLLTKP